MLPDECRTNAQRRRLDKRSDLDEKTPNTIGKHRF